MMLAGTWSTFAPPTGLLRFVAILTVAGPMRI
jgi:hypothetical protein